MATSCCSTPCATCPSHEEISQALGIPFGTVGSRLSRARKKVRSVIEEDSHG
ncbi:MAG TPA: sigma factor-like helix-turn-helix DNA-binding protein [Actinoallomurus sp.]|nr:sigma factor-like helix-turn-helix DNA-binding protein [Actinoallomurus sp.]